MSWLLCQIPPVEAEGIEKRSCEDQNNSNDSARCKDGRAGQHRVVRCIVSRLRKLFARLEKGIEKLYDRFEQAPGKDRRAGLRAEQQSYSHAE